MRLGTLLPFAALGVLIVVVSSAALLSTTHGGVTGPVAEPSASAAGATPRAIPELSKTARLAYWREGRLWVSGLDGSLRRTLAPIDDPRRLTDMRWSPDGGKIAFIDAGHSMVVVRVDGERWDVTLPIVLRDQGWRIAEIHWAPDSTRIAATFLRPGDGRADIFLTDITPALAMWARATELGDAFASEWVSDTELLASTAGGVIAVLEIAPAPPGAALESVIADSVRVRPLSGALGTSPILASDGRIHFLAGRVPTSRDPSLPYITASRASIWSAALDGSDVRRESLVELNDVRLDARLPDGRYLVHRGGTSVQHITGEEIQTLPANGGVIERVRLSPDGRTAYGFTRDRIVQLDISKVGRTPPASPEPSATVFLDTGGEADVWFPTRIVAVARGGEPVAAQPAGRYAFYLGGHYWQMGPAAKPGLLRPGQAARRTLLPVARWSPSGSHLLALEQAGVGAPTTALIAVVLNDDGEQTRLADTYASARSFAWAPEGNEIAVVVDRRGVNGTASNADLEVRFMDPSGKVTRSAIPGSEVAWTSRGILVLTQVNDEAVLQLVARDGTALTALRRLDLVKDQRIAATPWLGGAWSSLDAPLNGSWISLRLTTAEGTSGYVVLIDAAGRPAEFISSADLSDAAWSPTKPLLGYTLSVRTPNERAVVHEPGNGGLMFQDGRFAGWSPDGEWYYVARTTGLFAYPLSGGLAARVGSIGVPVAVTAP